MPYFDTGEPHSHPQPAAPRFNHDRAADGPAAETIQHLRNALASGARILPQGSSTMINVTIHQIRQAAQTQQPVR